KIERGGDGIVAAFLSAQGRVLYDAFIYPKNIGSEFPHPSFLVECDQKAVDPLYAHLRKYLLRAKVKVTKVSDAYKVFQAWGPHASTQWHAFVDPGSAKVLKQRFSDVGCIDPRHADLGCTILVTYGFKMYGFDYKMQHADQFRFVMDFRKGCYLGQELTIRTFHTGVTRKRIVPFFISPKQRYEQHLNLCQDRCATGGIGDVSEGGVGKKAEIGKFCGSMYNVGLGLMRLDRINDVAEGPFVTENGLVVRPFIPRWW
ncbi:hypothetical protein BC829DRAFT_350807, partial [Chytridium lagenaria]